MKTVVVPVEPTEEMIIAGCAVIGEEDIYARDVWEAMLSASPPSSEPVARIDQLRALVK